MLDVGRKKLLWGFFNLFVFGMSCTAQIRGKKEKNKQVLAKRNNCQVYRMEITYNVMGFAHLSSMHRGSKASGVKLPVQWAEERGLQTLRISQENNENGAVLWLDLRGASS